MQVDLINGAAVASTTSTASTETAKVDYDAFLQLLVAELGSQDPTQPLDSTAYVSQLATFSQVEQSIQTNTKLDTVINSNVLILAESLIGNTITSADGSRSGEIASVRLTPDGAVAVLKDGTELSVGPGVTIA